MAIINGVDMPNFERSEFSEDPEHCGHHHLLQTLQWYRETLGAKIQPSKSPGALARFDGRKTSMHFIDLEDFAKSDEEKRSKALDVFCTTHIFKAWTVAMNFMLWSGIGVYFDTKGNNGEPWPMLHFDLRLHPLIWYRDQGEYFYPHKDKDFYTNLLNLFMIHRVKK